MVKLVNRFDKLGASRLLVIGDLLLDTYTRGKARRISPEAPVAVVHVSEEESLPGGAGNVMLNLISLGAEVIAVGRVGADPLGQSLRALLAEEGVDVRGVIQQTGYNTPVKNRIIADNQQIVRVDYEEIVPLRESVEESIIRQLPELLEGVDLIAVSDYGKGFVTKALMQALVEAAGERVIITDPKGVDFRKYVGTTIIKPNLGEVYAAANLPLDAPLELAADRVLKISQAKTLMVTRSEAGISLFHNCGKREDFPVKVREVLDVTGAGDTVLATVAHGLANELDITESTQLGNIAAGIAIERFGCARITLAEVARRLLEYDVTSKVFDEKHLFALQAAVQGQDVSVMQIYERESITPEVYEKIRGSSDQLLYLPGADPTSPFVKMLASLSDVQFIVVDEAVMGQLAKLDHFSFEREASCVE